MNSPLLHEKVWFEKGKYDAAERLFYENLVKVRHDMASWKVRPWTEAVKSVKWTGIGYSELQYTLDPTHTPLRQ